MRGISNVGKKKYMFVIFFCFCLICISVYFTSNNKVSAAYKGYYSTYRTETKIENGSAKNGEFVTYDISPKNWSKKELVPLK